MQLGAFTQVKGAERLAEVVARALYYKAHKAYVGDSPRLGARLFPAEAHAAVDEAAARRGRRARQALRAERRQHVCHKQAQLCAGLRAGLAWRLICVLFVGLGEGRGCGTEVRCGRWVESGLQATSPPRRGLARRVTSVAVCSARARAQRHVADLSLGGRGRSDCETTTSGPGTPACVQAALPCWGGRVAAPLGRPLVRALAKRPACCALRRSPEAARWTPNLATCPLQS